MRPPTLRAVQRVAGPQLVRCVGLEPAEHHRPSPGGRAHQLEAVEQPQQGRLRRAPSRVEARRIRATCAAVRAGFSRFNATASSSTAGVDPAAGLADRRAPARRTRRPGSADPPVQRVPGVPDCCPPNGPAWLPGGERADHPAACLGRQPRVQRRADQLVAEQRHLLRPLPPPDRRPARVCSPRDTSIRQGKARPGPAGQRPSRGFRGSTADASGATRVGTGARPRRGPARREQPTTRTRRGDLPRRHRAEHPDRARTGRSPPPSPPPTRPARPATASPSAVGTGRSTPARRGHLQQEQPDRLQPAAHHPQPAPHRRRRNPKLQPDPAVPAPAARASSAAPITSAAYARRSQHRHRQQHMRDQTPGAPGPPRPQHPRDPTHSTRPRPPPRTQHPRARRTANLPGQQPRLDPNLICLYRDQRVPPRIQHGPPAASSRTYGGRAVRMTSPGAFFTCPSQ